VQAQYRCPGSQAHEDSNGAWNPNWPGACAQCQVPSAQCSVPSAQCCRVAAIETVASSYARMRQKPPLLRYFHLARAAPEKELARPANFSMAWHATLMTSYILSWSSRLFCRPSQRRGGGDFAPQRGEAGGQTGLDSGHPSGSQPGRHGDKSEETGVDCGHCTLHCTLYVRCCNHCKLNDCAIHHKLLMHCTL
jgi:hypothetical protein